MTPNNELFRRLQKEAPALAQVVSEDADAMKRLDEMETERIANDVATMLREFVPGLTILER